jgi:hypothetical protein
MTQTFKIKKGEISFESYKIIITDDSKDRYQNQIFHSSIWIIYGTLSVLRYLNKGDQFLLWTGLFILIAHAVIIILNLLRSNRSEIFLNEIKSMKVKQRFKKKSLDIRLKNNKLRRVTGIDNLEELENYIKSKIENRLH